MPGSVRASLNGPYKWVAGICISVLLMGGGGFAAVQYQSSTDHERRLTRIETQYEGLKEQLTRIEVKLDRSLRSIGSVP
jgi:hypothetical protein